VLALGISGLPLPAPPEQYGHEWQECRDYVRGKLEMPEWQLA